MKVLPISEKNSTIGTSFHDDTIYASANEICKKLGVSITCYYGDKTHFEFELELEDGTPFSIYDWKESDLVDEDMKLYYHIGARNPEDSHKVLEVLKGYGFQGYGESDMKKKMDFLLSMLS